MEEHGKKVETVVKDALQTQAGPSEEISLDRFFHLAGMEPAQFEAICSTKVGEGPDPIGTADSKDSSSAADVRSRADEDATSYRRKLAAYQEGQQKQAQLIQKLQSKVLQYKKRTSDLELEVEQLKSELETSDKVLRTTTENLNSRIDASESRARLLEQEHSYDVENTLAKLQEEQQRANDLARANELLRDQLDQAIQANQGLSQDVARLTLAWRHAAQQLDKRETEWREEENAFNDYFAAEHSRLLALWRTVVGLRRQFGDLRQQTDRDLTQVGTEFARYIRNIQSVCGNLEVNMREAQAQAQATQKRESKQASAIEAEAADRIRNLTESLARSQARLAETEARLTETIGAKERLASQLADRDRILSTMSQLRSGIYSVVDETEFARHNKKSKRNKRAHEGGESSDEDTTEPEALLEDPGDHLKATKLLIEHTHVMHQALSQIAQLVISDSMIADSDEAEEPLLSMQLPEWSSGLPESADGFAPPLPPRATDKKTPRSEEGPQMQTRAEAPPALSLSPSHPADFREGVESDQMAMRPYGLTKGDITALKQLAHSKYRAGSSLHLAESTVSAVQTSLNRRAAHVHRLRYRTHGLKDQVQALIRRTEELDAERRRTVDQLARLREELESQSLESDKLARERDRIKHNMNLMEEEKKMSENSRASLGEQIRELQVELDRHRSMVHDVSKQREDVLSERERLQADHSRLVRELNSVKSSLQSAEERAAGYREELTSIREALRRTELDKEVLNQEKTEAVGTGTRARVRVDELEQKVSQLLLRETQLKDRVAQLEAQLETHERDNQHLTQQTALAQATELRLSEERSSLRAERQQLREELDRVYADRGSLTAELEQLKDNIARVDVARNRLEAENAELSHERLALVEALNGAERQKAAMLDDLTAYRRENERQAGVIKHLSEEKESVAKQKAELVIQLSIVERDTRQLNDQITRFKDEKETLESGLFDAQQLITELQSKKQQYEREIAELKLRRDTLQAELLRAHTNFQVELDKSQRSQKELGTQLNTELEDLRCALNQAERRAKEAEEACLQAVVRADQAVTVMGRQQQLEAETITDREIELRKSAEEVNRLTRSLLATQRERDEARLHAEQERQRALLRAAEEKSGLQERVGLLQQTITELQSALDRAHQENTVQGDQDRTALRKATEEVRTFRNQLEETCSQHEKEVRELRVRVHELEGQRDQLVKETNELQLQTRLAEESRDGNRADLLEITRRMRSAEETCDSVRRECAELRQRFAEVEREKNALDASNDELRRQLKTAEMERVELVRMTNVTRSQLQGTEMDRSTAERRIADLQDHMKEISNSAAEARREATDVKNRLKKVNFEKQSLEQEANDLRNQIKDILTREDTAKREKAGMKQRLTDMECAKTALQNEVNNLSRQLTDMEEALRSRERAASQAAEEWHRDFRRLDETKTNLEGKLEQCNLVIGELRASLAETQTHLRGVEAELSETLASRQEAEARLSAIHSILRRLLGFRQSQYSSRLGLRNEGDASGTEGPDDTEDEKSRKSGAGTREADRMTDSELRFRLSEEFENDWELRRIAERVVSQRTGQATGMNMVPKPKQRIRRRQDQDGDQYPSPIAQSFSQMNKRSKSMSPSRDKKDPLPERSTSNERRKENKFSFHEGRLHDSVTLGDLDAVDLPARWLQTMRQHLNGARYRGLPGSDLDPEAVRMLLRDFLRHLVQIERERDSNEMALRTNEGQLADMRRQLHEYEQRIKHLQQTLGGIERGKSEVLQQVSSMKSVISEQESLMLKRDRDLDDVRDRMVLVERQLAVCEAEKQQLQVRMDKAKTAESRLEEDRRQLLRGLDDAETRYTQAEVSRRRLEGELHRMQTAMSDLETEKQSLHCRLEATARQNADLEARVHSLQSDVDRLSEALNQANQVVNDLHEQMDRDKTDKMTLEQEVTEQRGMISQLQKRESAINQERRLLEERLESSRTNLNQTKSRLHETLERVQELQLETSDGALQRSELETQLRQLANVSAENQQTNSELQTKLTTLQNEHTTIVEKNAELLRSLNDLGLQKHELECELTRTRKEHAQWKKTAERLDRERLREQDASTKLRTESTELGKTIRRLEEENLDLRRDLQKLQAHVAQQEDTQAARLVEVNTKQRLESEAEMERQRLALTQAEKVIQQKERSHRQKVRGLEEQVALLKDQLSQEMTRRQLFLSRSQNLASYTSPSQPNLHHIGTTTAGPELGDIRSPLDISLPQETYLPGLYKPTIAPSRYDPYYYQVTGSIPSQLDRSYGSGSGRYSRDRDSGIVHRVGQSVPSPVGVRATTLQTTRCGDSAETRLRSVETPGSNTATDTTTTGQSSASKAKDSPVRHIPSRYMATASSLNRSTSESTIRRKET